MRLIASKLFNHGKNSEQLGRKSKRSSVRKRPVFTKNCSNQKTMIYGSHTLTLSPNPKALKVDPEKFHEFFIKTDGRLFGNRKTDNATL